MTIITIPLNSGYNYISFPATSTANFSSIFVNSGITEKTFSKYDSIFLRWVDINDLEYIEPGRGYLLFVPSSTAITYEGIQYSMTFDQLKSKLFEGWNLIGTGSNSISQPNWCKIIDPTTNFPVTTEIIPKKAYWINSVDCVQHSTDPLLFISIVGLGLAIISILMSSKGSKDI